MIDSNNKEDIDYYYYKNNQKMKENLDYELNNSNIIIME